MKKNIALAVMAASLMTPSFMAASAWAQTRTTTTPPAVSDPKDTAKTTAAPVAGKNSFTEKEVTKRLQDNGYTNVTAVTLDKATGVWQATATKGGATGPVQVDYQGNITAGNNTPRKN